MPKAKKDLMKVRAERRLMTLRDCSVSDLTRRRYLKECTLFLEYCCMHKETPFDVTTWDTFMRAYIENC